MVQLSAADVAALRDVVPAEASPNRAEYEAMVWSIVNAAAANGRSVAEEVASGRYFGYTTPSPGGLENRGNPTLQGWLTEIIPAVASGQIPDPTRGATHFEGDAFSKPAWAAGMTPTTIGATTFYAPPGSGKGASSALAGAPMLPAGRANMAPLRGVDEVRDAPRQTLEGAGRGLPFTNARGESYLEYLAATATPGGTMSRQGVDTAMARLEPTFAGNLARAIEQARAEGIPASVFSAYRAPEWGVGGYADKSNSLHSYGLSVDVAGIGRPGSTTAERWHQIATENGLYNPYGPGHRAEWNHYQAVPQMGRQWVEANRDAVAQYGMGGRELSPQQLAALWQATGFQTAARDPAPVPRDNPSRGPAVASAERSGSPWAALGLNSPVPTNAPTLAYSDARPIALDRIDVLAERALGPPLNPIGTQNTAWAAPQVVSRNSGPIPDDFKSGVPFPTNFREVAPVPVVRSAGYPNQDENNWGRPIAGSAPVRSQWTPAPYSPAMMMPAAGRNTLGPPVQYQTLREMVPQTVRVPLTNDEKVSGMGKKSGDAAKAAYREVTRMVPQVTRVPVTAPRVQQQRPSAITQAARGIGAAARSLTSGDLAASVLGAIAGAPTVPANGGNAGGFGVTGYQAANPSNPYAGLPAVEYGFGLYR